jgi:phosphoribosyl 1,2-cyclic phosphodiesterase
MENAAALRVKFWGVRGSIPVPARHYLACGGNTTCVEIRAGKSIIVIDSGTGIRGLGMSLQEEFAGAKLEIHVLLTHFHWDHIQGLPFFAPLYSAEHEIKFYSAHPPEKLQELLEGEMSTPYFPVDFDLLPARRSFEGLTNDVLRLPDASVYPFPMNHPQGATGFRIEAGGRVITHASDLEHGNPQLDQTLRKYGANSDLLIYDAQYTPEQYPSKQGWGHSTWLEATRVARDCNAKRLLLFHHDPEHDDPTMQTILNQARQHFAATDVAQEGMEIIF